ncbi:hypothetical protein [Pseudoroseicyclus aestuarii]|uniref:Uncharacterized protein n=1 Tax=Pseudoroseicyclus aestuarii TaxID=1795041 RepID=A0A318SWY8_9RHOB|nr:hypothetical protein [Pseudoroseicyclus aestuarii]PYE85973.1 hypothetical protein DFP88_101647 [Pseudoroseicyclus aestuarii]
MLLRSAGLPCALALLLGPWAGEARAAAWPRGAGQSFLTLSYQHDVAPSDDAYGGLYYERGLSDSLTFGLTAGHNPVFADSNAIAFLRKTLTPEGSDVFALSLGAGWVEGAGAALRPGASWGRGWQRGAFSGWYGVEATFAYRADATTELKVDPVIGLNLEGGALAVLQLQTSRLSGGDWQVGLAPSWVRPVGDGLMLEMGAVWVPQDENLALKLGLWTEF